ncbi:MAG: ArsR/SmtB family transcription factor [Rhodopila sp.]
MSGPADRGHACDPEVAAELFRALAHPMRVRILCRLLDGEISVAGLENELGLRQPSLSQQLGQLRDAGVVTTRRAAKSVYYTLADQRVRIIVDALRVAAGEPPASTRPAAAAMPRAVTQRPAPARSGSTECAVFAIVGRSASE